MTTRAQRYQRPKPIAWLFFLGAMAVTLSLGTWQIDRLEWKEGLIAELAEANAQDPLTTLPSDPTELEPLQFRKVVLKGTWIKDIEFHIAPRYFKGEFGYALVTPLKLKDGRIVLVNRGWVPGKKKLIESRPETAVHGKATVSGLVRVGAERGYFTPTSQPDKNIWFGRDIEDMAASTNLTKVIPAMVDMVGSQEGRVIPIPSDGTIRLRNDHLSYIATWYGIALGILVIFLVYHRKKR